MSKDNDRRDIGRRYKYVSKVQDELAEGQRVPQANSKWPTALIIVPVTVMGNWERELDTVSIFCSSWKRIRRFERDPIAVGLL